VDWIPAAFGLLGVIAGGLITAASSYYLDLRRERASTERESVIYAIEIKRAARLIDLELAEARAAVKSVKKLLLWSPDMEPKTEAWEKYGPIMAPRLSFNEWKALTIAVQRMKDVNTRMKLACLGAATPCEVTAADTKFLSPTIKDIEAALAVTSSLVSDVTPTPPKVSLNRRMVLHFLYNE